MPKRRTCDGYEFTYKWLTLDKCWKRFLFSFKKTFYIDKESQKYMQRPHNIQAYYIYYLKANALTLSKHLRGVATNVCTRAPASSKVGLGIDVGSVAQTEGNGGVLGAQSVHLEVRGSR
jgi:hypothetical protein